MTIIVAILLISQFPLERSLIQQIKDNIADGMLQYDTVVETTVQRSRPVILTALTAVLAFIPLTQSSFWGSMAYTLIGGTAIGTIPTLLFLPALMPLGLTSVQRK
ncbi:hypothetical protein [Shewanella surugensis]|uniref:Efflux RND transporter permease subunit n=1 Tax=Shewanella surugensis TaxID=212020 RepID=A0ABT0LBV5_9GAMM|nr:hypothetical protein [Shewanella surugensis]MCL1125143.1 hypothetical protein [Shewanella surugensis]